MIEIKSAIQAIAPTLAAALGGPFAGVAVKFISDGLIKGGLPAGKSAEAVITELLKDSVNLKKIKEMDHQFKLEMNELGVDVFSLEIDNAKNIAHRGQALYRPQITISILFLTTYFLMLAAIFFVEISDTINMKKGDNSLMGELQILFGVLTAGVGQVLSYWFGGRNGKNDISKN